MIIAGGLRHTPRGGASSATQPMINTAECKGMLAEAGFLAVAVVVLLMAVACLRLPRTTVVAEAEAAPLGAG